MSMLMHENDFERAMFEWCSILQGRYKLQLPANDVVAKNQLLVGLYKAENQNNRSTSSDLENTPAASNQHLTLSNLLCKQKNTIRAPRASYK